MCFKRSDGTLVRDSKDPIGSIMPYVMRGRNESAVYMRKSYCVENMQQYIREQRKQGKRITVFNIISATFLHTFLRRPQLNRFISGRRLYQHNSFDILYVVKTALTDEGIESIAKVNFDGDDTLEKVKDKMDSHIEAIKGSEGKEDDRFIGLISKLPRSVLRILLWIGRVLDFHGLMPKSLRDLIPLYSSVFISHLGSIGGDALFHHLYEFGSTSIFCTIGKVYYKPYRDIYTDGVVWKKTIDLNLTIDERICDGYYMIKSLQLFDAYIDNPALLELSPKEAMAEEERKREQRLMEQQKKSSAVPDVENKSEPQGQHKSPMQDYWEDMMEHPTNIK
ncbi:MAG TPA: 2-oxo acid dehydrogenase subunit E2 [Clostridiaceae bacterium]|nr:2-oxo acid dehydrogenase subunit E2 [Clostridiaceae bacterium]